MKSILLTIATLTLSGCATTTTHYGSKPDFESLSLGMDKQQTIDALGKPERISAKGGFEYLHYGWDDPWDGKIGAAERYFVRLLDGKVESYGLMGDFDSAKDPTININQKIKIEEK